MLKTKIIILMTIFSLMCVAHAGTKMKAAKQPTPKVWTQEPDSFLGIKFSSPIAGDVPACPLESIGHVDYSRVTIMCADNSYTKDYFTFKGAPELGFPYQLNAKTYNGKVGYFYLDTNPASFPLMAKLFITKYGEPTDIKTFEVTTKGGADFENTVLLWQGKKVLIRLKKYSGDIETSTAVISDIEYEAAQAKALEDANASGASKL